MTYSGYGYNQQDWDSEYDSTWEDDEEDKQPKTKRAFQQFSSQRRAARDLQNYRHGYPENYRHGYPDASPKPNLLFYQNKMPFEPHGEYIDEIHRSWRYDYDELEHNHNFIQWLFPLREPGVNRCATPLTLSEIQLMKKDKAVMKRFLESYKLMLGFYGIVLLDPDTGAVARAEENWNDRFQNLNRNTHNNLRITRILKCLGEMGYEKFQAPLVRFFLEETLCNGNLPRVKQSALDYFMFTVKDKKERQNLVHFAWVHNKPENKFIWGPVEKLQKFNPPPQNAEQDAEVDISEEVKIQMPSENDSSEGDKEFAETENKRERGLVRRTVGYVCRPFLFFSRLLFIPFLAIFRFLFRPFRYFFGGGIFWFRGEARNEDGFNEEQISTKTEGTKTERTKVAAVNMSVEYKESEHEPLLEDPGRQKTHKAEFKELNVRADVKTWSKTEANLGIEANGSTYESIPENGTGLADKKPLVCIEIPEYTQATEDDDNTENEHDLRNFRKGKKLMKSDEGQTSENDQFEGAEEGSEKEDNDAGNGEVSDVHTEDSETDSHGGGRGHGGTRIANAGNHIEETKIYNVKSEVEDASKVKCEGDDAEKAKINKIEYHTETSTVRLEDNDGGDFGPQNTLSSPNKTDQVESDDGKTKTEEVVNVKLSPHVGEKGDEDENPNISKIEENRGAAVPGSGDNGGENIGAQITEPEKDQSQQVERVCHDIYSNSENEEGTKSQ